MRRFKARKRHNYIIFYISLFLVTVSLSIKYIYDKNMINDDTLVDILVNDTFKSYKKSFNSVDFLMKYALNINIEDKTVIKEEVKENKNENTNIKVENINTEENVSKDPIIYIYNTHQDEKYKRSQVGSYNVTPNVLLASKILKEYLEKEGIIAVVEETPVTEKLHSLGWSYGSSYKLSRILMEDAKKKNPSLTYFVDIHRDSSKYENTTTTIDEEKYAKLLFVVGLDNKDYEENLKLVETLKEKINSYNSKLFRGIMKKYGKGVNGIYNQDFSPNTFLVEVGGQYNNISEVNNTLKVFAKILSNYIKETN